MTAPRVTRPAGPAGFRAALERLRSAQKSSKGAPAYSLYVNRPLGRIFAAAAFQLGLTPNQVTVISAGFTFAGIAVLALAPLSWWIGLVVGSLLVLGYALDSADGQLARLRGGGSSTGEWLDHMIDSGKIVCLHLAVLIMLARRVDLPTGWLFVVPMIFAAVSTVHFFGMILVEQLGREHRAKLGLPTPPKQVASRGKTLAKIPTDYGVLCLAFLLLGAPMIFLGVYSVLALGSAGYLLLILRKWYGDVAALDADVSLASDASAGAR
ncbi:MAG TPA: CDP-alcohol phosphatidyltransferase family protein [Microlunatus sp.]|nr:CDP-alcohol phosphatidyltransferase family protein [Microlunatus sp.]